MINSSKINSLLFMSSLLSCLLLSIEHTYIEALFKNDNTRREAMTCIPYILISTFQLSTLKYKAYNKVSREQIEIIPLTS